MITLEDMKAAGLKDKSIVSLVLKVGTRCIEGNKYLFLENPEDRDNTDLHIESAGRYLEKVNESELGNVRKRFVLYQNNDLNRVWKSGVDYNASEYDWNAIESYKIFNE